ncbi:Flap endonuclease 1 [Bienertia sinuspersici]
MGRLFPMAKAEHFIRYKSDHTPILLRSRTEERSKRRRGKIFKFEIAWLLDDTCEEVMRDAWDKTSDIEVIDKTKKVGGRLTVWSKEKFDDLGKKIEVIELELKVAQAKETRRIADPWLGYEEGRFITTDENENVQQVCDLIDRSTMEWNINLIGSMFNKRDQRDSGCEVLSKMKMNDLFEWVVHWAKDQPNLFQRATYLMWVLWRERNLKVFKDKMTPNHVLLTRALRLVEEYGQYNAKIFQAHKSIKIRSSGKWKGPVEGMVKVNVNASLNGEGWVRMGIVARDSRGLVLFAATRRVRAMWPPEKAECKALLLAVKLAGRHGYKDVIVESDCQVVINHLSRAVVFFTVLIQSSLIF